MENILGVNNTLTDYLLVLLIYGLMFLFIRYPKPVVELNYRTNFRFLFIVWTLMMFSGNYLFYRLHIMSFLPWLNNFIHSFIWIGVCLTWLYYSCHHRPLWEQFIHFAFSSFIIKIAEKQILGSWSMDGFYFFKGEYAYVIAMSLVDGFYPILSLWYLKWASKNKNWSIYLGN